MNFMEMLLESLAWVALGFVPHYFVWKYHGEWAAR
jgi:hypothetical protein